MEFVGGGNITNYYKYLSFFQGNCKPFSISPLCVILFDTGAKYSMGCGQSNKSAIYFYFHLIISFMISWSSYQVYNHHQLSSSTNEKDSQLLIAWAIINW